MNPIAPSLFRIALFSTFVGLLILLPVGLRPASAADAAVSVTAPVNIPGASATISASGFSAGETVHISFGPEKVELVANESGAVSTSLPVPRVPASLQFASAFGESSGKWAIGYIWIAGFNPIVAPNSWYVLPGQALSFSGAGFGTNEPVTAMHASTTLATYTTDASGSFAGPATSLPLSLSNTTATIIFTGASSTAQTSVTLTVGALYPYITPSSWFTAPGSTISLTGTGFAPNEPIAVTAGSHSASTTANTLGSFTLASLPLPTTAGTSIVVTATGGASAAQASASVTLSGLFPWLTFSTYWAQGGSPFTIFGNGFAAGEQVALSSGSSAIGTTTTDGTGIFSFLTTVPYAPSGQITITGTGVSSGASGNGQMTVAPVYTDLQLASYAGAPGSAVTFLGNGYLANEPLSLTTDRTGSTTVASWTANASGGFAGSSYTIPNDFVEGLLSLTVTGLYSFTTKTILFYVTGG